jgi:hypothetical protein
MKGFFKLTTAALALVAMASCSNDEFLTNGQTAADAQAEGALQVEMEQLIDGVTTRAAYVPNGAANQLWWQNGDVIIVSDETLLQNDTYEFSEKRKIFENNSKDLVKTPAFAFTDDWKWGQCTINDKYWDTTKDQVIVLYDINGAHSDVDNDIASSKGNKVKAYEFSLPMWGKATKSDAGVSVNMKYLTGVLRVQMEQLPSWWSRVRIRAYKDQATANPANITGTFKAVISEEDEIDENAQLVLPTAAEISAGGYTYGNTIAINFNDWDSEALVDLRANGGYVYIPLIAQSYGAILFEYWDPNTATWKLYKKTKPVDVKRGVVYRMNVEEFEIAGSDAESLNVLLEKKKDETGSVTVKTTYPTEMTKDGNGEPLNVIKIPAGFKAESLTLDLKGIDASATGLPFELESEDGQYAGDVVIDLSDGTVTALPAIYLNLPNSNVVIKGDFGTANLGTWGTTTQNKLIVNSLTIAPISQEDTDKGFTATSVGNIWPNYESFQGGAEPGIYVQENTTVNGDIDLDKPNENKDKTVGNTSIKIEGNVTGYVYAPLRDPNYTAKKKQYYSEIPVTVGKKAVVGKIKTASDITISDEATISGKAETLFGTITMTGGKADELKAGTESGLVEPTGIITMSGKSQVTTAVEAKVKADLSGEATATNVTAPEVDLSEKANVTTLAKATTLSIVGTAWAQAATMDATATATTATINVSAEGEAIKGDFTVANTAITLTQGYIKNIAGGKAELTFGEGEGFTAIGGITASGLVFKNASTWNGKKIADDFKTAGYVGPYPITGCQLASWDFSLATTLINDIDLNNQAWTPVELKANLNGSEKTIKNLAVTATANDAGLFSKVTAGGTIANLTIDGAAVAATGKENVGVLAGSATTALTINKVVVKNATVEGKYFLGGFVGNAKGATVDGDSNANGVTFTVNNPNNNPKITDKSDEKAGSVGQFFGQIDGTTTITPAWTSSINPATDGFRANFYVKPGSKAYCYYDGTTAVGLYGSSVTTITLGTTSYTIDDHSTDYDKKTDVPANTVGYYLLVSAW